MVEGKEDIACVCERERWNYMALAGNLLWETTSMAGSVGRAAGSLGLHCEYTKVTHVRLPYRWAVCHFHFHSDGGNMIEYDVQLYEGDGVCVCMYTYI